MDLRDAQTLDGALRDWLDGQPAVDAAWLFGSRARGDERVDSDLDIALLPSATALPLDDAGRLKTRLRWAASVARRLALPQKRVDLILIDEAPPPLAHSVLKGGRLLLDRNPMRRVRFEEDVLHRHIVATRLRDEAMRLRAARFGVDLGE